MDSSPHWSGATLKPPDLGRTNSEPRTACRGHRTRAELTLARDEPFYIPHANSLYAMNPLTAILAAILPAPRPVEAIGVSAVTVKDEAGLEINHIELSPSPQP